MLTSRRVRAIYATLLAFPPFNRWGLPSPDVVQFEMLDGTSAWGEFALGPNGRFIISINPHMCKNFLLAQRVVAHEMCHLKQHLLGRLPSGDVAHNKVFYRLAGQVCKHMGYDMEHF